MWWCVWATALLGGGRGGNKRNPLVGGGNNGNGGAVAIQLPSMGERSRRAPSESAMSSLGPTRPASAAMMRDAGRILSVDSFDEESFDQGDLVAGVVGGMSGTAHGGGGGGGGGGGAKGGQRSGAVGGGGGGDGLRGGAGSSVAPGGGVQGGGSGSNQVLVRRIDGDFDRDGVE